MLTLGEAEAVDLDGHAPLAQIAGRHEGVASVVPGAGERQDLRAVGSTFPDRSQRDGETGPLHQDGDRVGRSGIQTRRFLGGDDRLHGVRPRSIRRWYRAVYPRRMETVTLTPVIDLLNLIRGVLMGAANIVPGVSGGTMALVLGIYERLVHGIRVGSGALGALLRGRWSDARQRLGEVDWRFLVLLGIGILLASVALAAVIERLLEDHPAETAALFFGLVLGSILIAWRLITTRDAVRYAVMAAVAVAAFLLLGLQQRRDRRPGDLDVHAGGRCWRSSP